MCSATQLCPTLCDPLDCSLQGSSGIFQEEYWRGLLFPPPGDLLDPGIEPMSPALASGFFSTEPPGRPENINTYTLKMKKISDLLGSPVVKTSQILCRGHGFNPAQGTEIPHALWPKKKGKSVTDSPPPRANSWFIISAAQQSTEDQYCEMSSVKAKCHTANAGISHSTH